MGMNEYGMCYDDKRGRMSHQKHDLLFYFMKLNQ